MPLVLTDAVFREHRTGDWHPEAPRRLDAAIEGVRRAGAREETRPGEHPDTERMIRRLHDATLIDALDEACAAREPFFGSLDNAISPSTALAARTAVSIGLRAAESILGTDGEKRAFVIARPPGHHAERSRAIGFCYFNTIACATEWLRERAGIERVFILDWDVHHGNGTQQIFEQRADVFYLSLHSYPFFPGTGSESERGVGQGEGATRNIPLRAGSGDDLYLRLFEQEVVPEIERFSPDVILISAGFDAHRDDPIGNMSVSSTGFGEMTRRVVEVAEAVCGGRILSLLEGGYDLEALAESVEQHVVSL